MKRVLIIGAGKSASVLIDYLGGLSTQGILRLTVGDISEELAQQKVKKYPNASGIFFDVYDEAILEKHISESNVVISMLPAAFHDLVAVECVKYKKHLLTASYLSPAITALETDAEKAGILIMGEMGLDPGIDHMTAMEIIHDIQEQGGEIKTFKSYTGGLIAPESDTNPWHYKFTWNPRNVVLAGQGVASYLKNSSKKYIPYQRLFSQLEHVSIPKYGEFEGYTNRDSLHYIELYGLNNIQTILRGTLRYKGYCDAWNVFVRLGLTDDNLIIENANKLTYAQFLKAFLPESDYNLKELLREKFELNEDTLQKLTWLEVFNDRKIMLKEGTPAQILQDLLEEKWQLEKNDIDMIVMQHQFEYELDGEMKRKLSSMAVKGTDQIHTAMAKTVGLPLGILAKLLLEDKVSLRGVHIPIMPAIYQPVLVELKDLGVEMIEH